MRLLPVVLGIPGAIHFPVLFAHHRSPRSDVTEEAQSEKSYLSLLSHPRQQPVRELVKCFFMDSLLEVRPPALLSYGKSPALRRRLPARNTPGPMAAHGRIGTRARCRR